MGQGSKRSSETRPATPATLVAASLIACAVVLLAELAGVVRPGPSFDAALRAILCIVMLAAAFQLLRSRRARSDVALEAAQTELASARERLLEMEREETRLLAQLTEELRAPLALILGPLERVRDQGGLSPERREDVEIALRNAQVLLQRLDARVGRRTPSGPMDEGRDAPLSSATVRAATEAPSEARVAHGKPVVLLVEENPDMRKFTRSVLETDFDVASARSADEAYERLRTLVPAAIVTDATMPRKDGTQLVEAVRANRAFEGVPIVVLSARVDDAFRVEVLEKGASDYVAKPFTPAELRARVQNLVAMAQAREVLRRELQSEKGNVAVLVDELARKTHDLIVSLDSARRAREEAERASRIKTNFLDLLSHEIRTPLTSLQFDFELLRRASGDAVRRDKILDRVGRSIGRLTDQMAGVLEYASLQSGTIQPQPTNVDAVILAKDVARDLETRAANKGLELTVRTRGEVPPLRTDPDLLRAVLRPLVDNAIKYTERGSISVVIEHAGGEHRISVQDTGPGIPRKQQQRIFEPFEQLEPVTHKHTPGVGLGLAIARRLLEALGGRLELRSTEGEGSTFVCVLPTHAKAEAA